MQGISEKILTLIWVGFLGVHFMGWEGGEGREGVKLPRLKTVRIMLET